MFCLNLGMQKIILFMVWFWQWEQVKRNTQWIMQFGSTDDPFIPFSEQQQVAEGTAAEFHQFAEKGHFMSMAFPELVNKLMSKLQ